MADEQNVPTPAPVDHVPASHNAASVANMNMMACPKLEGVSNYTTWKFVMKMLLTLESTWGCVTGHDNDMMRDQRALARICLSIESNLYQYVRTATSAKEAWDKLASIFEDKGLYRRVLLLRQLHRMNLSDYTNMSNYISAVMMLVQQLADIGRNIEDAEVAEILLSGLSGDYDVLVSSLETACMSRDLSSELVRTRLLQEEHRKNGFDHSASGAAYSVTNKKVIICNYCKKPGHIKSKCFKLKKDKKRNSDEKTLIVTETEMAMTARHEWIVDSGCTAHMCNDKTLFTDFKTKKGNVTIANNDLLVSEGKGKVNIICNKNEVAVNDTLFVPELSTNLLSVNKLVESGYTVVFNKFGCNFYNNPDIVGSSIGHAKNHNGIYKLDCSVNDTGKEHSSVPLKNVVQGEQSAMSATETESLWHRRLGHLSRGGLRALRKNNQLMFQNVQEFNVEECIACLQGKQVSKPFPVGEAKRAAQPLELLHSDICGPMPVCSWGGARYLMTITDDYSRKSWGYLLRNKSEVMSTFITFKAIVENQTGLRIKTLRSDGGGEYCGAKFEAYLRNEGIVHQVTVPHTPQQNGVSERLNRTIMERTRCMLMESGLRREYWGEAVMTAMYLKNHSPTSSLGGSVPEQVWTGSSSLNLSHLRVFGCIAYALKPESKRNKLDSKSTMCVFVGYSNTTKGYRLVEPLRPRRIFFSRNVNFLENKFLRDMNKVLSNESKENNISFNFDMNNIQCNNSNLNNVSENLNINNNDNLIMNDNNSSQESNEIGSDSCDNQNISDISAPESEYCTGSDKDASCSSPAAEDSSICRNDVSQTGGDIAVVSPEVPVATTSRPARSTRGVKPLRYADYSLFTQAELEPVSYEEAMSSSNSEEWQRSMQREFEALTKNKVWELVDRPVDQKVVKCKWVYRIKNNNSENCKYKSRLVARGFSQTYGVDYDDTFSPVVRHSTLRTLFALATELDMYIEHLDVDTAFLNSKLNERIFMEQPQGFVEDQNKVCLLLKSIYGLKQASRMWNLTVHNLLIGKQFSQSKCEPCVYVKKDQNALTVIALYVDDFYVFSTHKTCIDDLYILLKKDFNVKNLGPIVNCLGMQVSHDVSKGLLTLNQSHYIRSLLVHYGMENCKPVSTPLALNVKLQKAEKEMLDDNVYKYRELLGSLMYLSVCTRPDITYACSQLSQFNNNFGKEHWLAAKRILRYLAGTLNYSLSFHRSGNLNVTAYADADWANNLVDRKSYTGFVIMIGCNTINWESRKQKCVALSSTEAEYLAISEVCKDLCFFKNFLAEIVNVKGEIVLFNDNQSALKLLQAKEYCHKKTKHIDLRYHYIKDLIQNKFANVQYMSTHDMIADVLTKPLSSTKHKNFINKMNVK